MVKTGHMRILWSIMGSIIGLILLSILFQQLRPVHPETTRTPALDFTSREQVLNAPIPDIAKEALMSPKQDQLDVRIEAPPIALVDDHPLRAFDEL